MVSAIPAASFNGSNASALSFTSERITKAAFVVIPEAEVWCLFLLDIQVTKVLKCSVSRHLIIRAHHGQRVSLNRTETHSLKIRIY